MPNAGFAEYAEQTVLDVEILPFGMEDFPQPSTGEQQASQSSTSESDAKAETDESGDAKMDDKGDT